MKKNNLEDRLVDFAVLTTRIAKRLIKDELDKYLANQIYRSGTSVALNYGEAQGAESQKDFAHKVKIVLKELRETFICLKIIKQGISNIDYELLNKALDENNQLISIFVKSIMTAQGRKPGS